MIILTYLGYLLLAIIVGTATTIIAGAIYRNHF